MEKVVLVLAPPFSLPIIAEPLRLSSEAGKLELFFDDDDNNLSFKRFPLPRLEASGEDASKSLAAPIIPYNKQKNRQETRDGGYVSEFLYLI